MKLQRAAPVSLASPIAAYVTDDPDTLREMMQDDRANIITQNIGRIVRRAATGKDSRHKGNTKAVRGFRSGA